MLIQIQGLYFNGEVDVTPSLLNQIWDAPESVGGGASRFKTNAGSAWKTEEGWGFSRSGSKPWGWVELHDPNPGQGRVRWSSQPLQLKDQARARGARGALIVDADAQAS